MEFFSSPFFFNLINYINISLTSLINDNWYFDKIDKNNIIEEDETLLFKIKNTFEEVMKDKKNLSKELKNHIKFRTYFHFSKNANVCFRQTLFTFL